MEFYHFFRVAEVFLDKIHCEVWTQKNMNSMTLGYRCTPRGKSISRMALVA